MAKAELKTKKTDASVEEFLESIEDQAVRKDCRVIASMMSRATGSDARMWGASIVGFGSYHYKYESGREGDWMKIGFAPRKQSLTLYIMSGFEQYDSLMSKLGKYKTGKSCLYVKRLSDIDIDVLSELIDQSVTYIDGRYPPE